MTATFSKSTAKEDVPYHMQEDSDEEPVVDDDEGAKPEGNDTAKAQSLASFTKPAEGESKESFIARKRARLGKVELDPKIRSSTPFPCSEANHDGSDYADFTKNGPGLESRASLDDEGMINVWVDLKKVLPDLPTDYARPVKEYAVDPVGSKDCPPLNIVIFIVGSRGAASVFDVEVADLV